MADTKIQVKDAAGNQLFPRVRAGDLVTNDLANPIFTGNIINSAYLPSYVDDVIDVEGAFLYDEITKFGTTSQHPVPTTLVSNAYYLDGSVCKIRHTNGTAVGNIEAGGTALEKGKIYVTTSGQQFRYTGAKLVPIVPFGANMAITTEMNTVATSGVDNVIPTEKAVIVAASSIADGIAKTMTKVEAGANPISCAAVDAAGKQKVYLHYGTGATYGVKLALANTTSLVAQAALTTGASNAYGTVAAWTTTDANVTSLAATAAGAKYLVPTMATLYNVKAALQGGVNGALTSVLATAPITATAKAGGSETIAIDIDTTATNGVKVYTVNNKLAASAALTTGESNAYGTVAAWTTTAASATSVAATDARAKYIVPTMATLANVKTDLQGSIGGRLANSWSASINAKQAAANKITTGWPLTSGVDENNFITAKAFKAVNNFLQVDKILTSTATVEDTAFLFKQTVGFLSNKTSTTIDLTRDVAGIFVGVRETSMIYAYNPDTKLLNPLAVQWSAISGRPAAYPPETHTHTKTQITDWPTSFPPSTHTHTKNQITDWPATFPPAAHDHSKANAGTTSGFVVTSNRLVGDAAAGSTYVVPTLKTVHDAVTSLATAINGKLGTHTHPYLTSANVSGTNGLSQTVTAGKVTIDGVACDGAGTIGVVRTSTLAAASVVSAAATHTYAKDTVPTVQTLYNVKADLQGSVGGRLPNAWSASINAKQAAANKITTGWPLVSGVDENNFLTAKAYRMVNNFLQVDKIIDSDVTPSENTFMFKQGTGFISNKTSTTIDLTRDVAGIFVGVRETSMIYAYDPTTHRLNPLAVQWSNISGRPPTYDPTSHQHHWSDITNKPTTYAPAAHDHTRANAGTTSGFVLTSNRLVSGATNGGTYVVPTLQAVTDAVTSLVTAINGKNGTIASYVKSITGGNGLTPTTKQTNTDATLACTNANAGTGVGVVYTSNRIPNAAVNGDTTSVVPTLGVIRASCLFYTTLA